MREGGENRRGRTFSGHFGGIEGLDAFDSDEELAIEDDFEVAAKTADADANAHPLGPHFAPSS